MARSLALQLSALERRHLRRQRLTAANGGDAQLLIDGRRVRNFCGNDYLGLARHPEAAAAMAAAAQGQGVGSGASHLVTGHGPEHELLEEELAAFTGRERALLFSTGYMANLAAVTALAGRGDAVLLDRLSHASLIDATLLSGARFARYAHGDAAAAGRALQRAAARRAPARTAGSARTPAQVPDPRPASAPAANPEPTPDGLGRGRRTLIVTDGVFSMDGDVAPLQELAALAARQNRAREDELAQGGLAGPAQAGETWLMVDDAHGIGVLGANGRGTLEHLGLGADAVPVLVGTLGKALGSFGAFVAGSAELIDWLIQVARPYIYTTALPQPVAAATRATLRLAQREPWRRERVLALTGRFRRLAAAAGLPLAPSLTPIQPVMLGDPAVTLAAADALLAEGFRVAAIRPPTVPAGSSRLRVTLSAAHSDGDVDALVDTLTGILRGPLGPRVNEDHTRGPGRSAQ